MICNEMKGIDWSRYVVDLSRCMTNDAPSMSSNSPKTNDSRNIGISVILLQHEFNLSWNILTVYVPRVPKSTSSVQKLIKKVFFSKR